MSFTNLPLFPSTCSLFSGDFTDTVYNRGHFATGIGRPRLSNVPCEIVSMKNIIPGSFTNPQQNALYIHLSENDSVPVLIYFPKGTDVRPWGDTITGQDSVKVDGKWSYVVNSVWPVACGFPGEFIAAYCVPAH